MKGPELCYGVVMGIVHAVAYTFTLPTAKNFAYMDCLFPSLMVLICWPLIKKVLCKWFQHTMRSSRAWIEFGPVDKIKFDATDIHGTMKKEEKKKKLKKSF